MCYATIDKKNTVLTIVVTKSGINAIPMLPLECKYTSAKIYEGG
jgi:hypothetical protein